MAKNKSGKGKKQSTVSKNRDNILTRATRGNKNDPKPGKKIDPDKYVDANRPVYVEP